MALVFQLVSLKNHKKREPTQKKTHQMDPKYLEGTIDRRPDILTEHHLPVVGFKGWQTRVDL